MGLSPSPFTTPASAAPRSLNAVLVSLTAWRPHQWVCLQVAQWQLVPSLPGAGSTLAAYSLQCPSSCFLAAGFYLCWAVFLCDVIHLLCFSSEIKAVDEPHGCFIPAQVHPSLLSLEKMSSHCLQGFPCGDEQLQHLNEHIRCINAYLHATAVIMQAQQVYNTNIPTVP